MKYLQIGLGSMGKRRIRNLQYLKQNDIIGFDIREDRMYEAKSRYQIETVPNYDDINWDSISHVIISTPPDKHMHYAIDAVKHNKHVFIEASVLDERMEELHDLCKNKTNIVAPSCTMRFDPIIVKTKEIIESGILGKNLFVNHHFGQFLPYWHPYESINDFYVSNPETGAAREIIPFDLVYLSWLLGEPKTITAMIKNTGTLGIDINDIYSLLYTTKQGTQVHMTIDVISKTSYRYTKIVAQNGNIEIDNVAGTLAVFNADSNTWEHFTRPQFSKTVSSEEMYVNEIESFLNATKGKGIYPYSLKEDHQILKYLYLAEQASHDNKILNVPEYD